MSNKKLEEIKNILTSYKSDIYNLIKQKKYDYSYKLTNRYAQELFNILNKTETKKINSNKELSKEEILKLMRERFKQT